MTRAGSHRCLKQHLDQRHGHLLSHDGASNRMSSAQQLPEHVRHTAVMTPSGSMPTLGSSSSIRRCAQDCWQVTDSAPSNGIKPRGRLIEESTPANEQLTRLCESLALFQLWWEEFVHAVRDHAARKPAALESRQPRYPGALQDPSTKTWRRLQQGSWGRRW
jgi:hypothetical protein